MATVGQLHKQAVKDYARLKELCGVSNSVDVHDICGAFCNTEYFKELLNNPTPKVALRIYRSLINQTFNLGFDDGQKVDIADHEVYEIYKRYRDY